MPDVVKENPSNFEDAVTRGLAQWLTLVRYDPVAKEFVVELTHDPDHPATQRIVRFAGVSSFEVSWHNQDANCMESLIGAHENVSGNSIRYLLVTERREIRLTADEKATIHEA